MGAKTFTCVICKAEISKPQSFAYKDGRACRHHQEAQEQHAISEQAKKDSLEQHKNKPHGFMHQHDPVEHKSLLAHFGMKDPNEHCWSCHKDGVYEHIIIERYLINMSKVELKSDKPVSPFEVVDGKIVNNQEVRTAVQAELGKDKEPLRRIEVSPHYPEWKLKHILNENRRQDKLQLVRMTGMIVLCRSCARENNFPWQYMSDKLDKSDVTKMLMLGNLIKPVIDQVAAKEIASEAISDIMKK